MTSDFKIDIDDILDKLYDLKYQSESTLKELEKLIQYCAYSRFASTNDDESSYDYCKECLEYSENLDILLEQLHETIGKNLKSVNNNFNTQITDAFRNRNLNQFLKEELCK